MADKTRLQVRGMTCNGCVRSVTTIISSVLGVDKDAVQVDLSRGVAEFAKPQDAARIAELIERLGRQGFEASL